MIIWSQLLLLISWLSRAMPGYGIAEGDSTVDGTDPDVVDRLVAA